LIFPAENDGWSHLYAVSLAGGPATLLTPGSFEIEWATPTLDQRHVLYSSNSGDPDRRHITSLDVTTGQLDAITTGNGIEVSPVPLHDGALAYLASDARQPMHVAIRHGERMDALFSEGVPADFPAAQLAAPQSVTLPMRAGQTAHGQIFLPTTSGKRHPAIIFMHGGPVRQMLAGWHYMDYYSNAYAMNQYLASQGYVVLALNYRAGIGYGFDFREAEHYGSQGASEYNDLLSAAEFLRGRSDVDPSRIGLWGGSYGGYMTALGLARNSDLFAAGVDLHGVHDWYNWSLGVRDRAPYYAADIPSDTLAMAYRSSPISSIDSWRSPVLLIHGDDDHNVPFDETVRLVTALQDRGISYSELVFPDEIHGFLRHESWLRAYQATADFLEQHLK
jgi:dipeptidyl aminopeptidase/acylaminoacyl peptidase